MTTNNAIRFKRSNIVASPGDPYNVLTIVKLDGGDTHFCEILNDSTPYCVEVTTGIEPDADYVGLYDLDGEEIENRSHGTWEVARASEVPRTVISAIEACWAIGTKTVERIAPKPSPTAIAYNQYGLWAAAIDGTMFHWPMYSDGTWYEDALTFEFACQHMVDLFNRDFPGNGFALDQFQVSHECDNCEASS